MENVQAAVAKLRPGQAPWHRMTQKETKEALIAYIENPQPPADFARRKTLHFDDYAAVSIAAVEAAYCQAASIAEGIVMQFHRDLDGISPARTAFIKFCSDVAAGKIISEAPLLTLDRPVSEMVLPLLDRAKEDPSDADRIQILIELRSLMATFALETINPVVKQLHIAKDKAREKDQALNDTATRLSVTHHSSKAGEIDLALSTLSSIGHNSLILPPGMAAFVSTRTELTWYAQMGSDRGMGNLVASPDPHRGEAGGGVYLTRSASKDLAKSDAIGVLASDYTPDSLREEAAHLHLMYICAFPPYHRKDPITGAPNVDRLRFFNDTIENRLIHLLNTGQIVRADKEALRREVNEIAQVGVWEETRWLDKDKVQARQANLFESLGA